MLGIGSEYKQTVKTHCGKRRNRDNSAVGYPLPLRTHDGQEHHRSRDLDSKSEIELRPHKAVLTDLPIPAFSSSNFGLNVAS